MKKDLMIQSFIALVVGLTLVYFGVRSGGVSLVDRWMALAIILFFIMATTCASRLVRTKWLEGCGVAARIFAPITAFVLILAVFAYCMKFLINDEDPAVLDYYSTIARKAFLVGSGVFGVQLAVVVWKGASAIVKILLLLLLALPSMVLVLLGYGL